MFTFDHFAKADCERPLSGGQFCRVTGRSWPDGDGRTLPVHSHSEARYHALGKTIEARRLHVTLIRVISARDMSRKERRHYEQATQDTR